MNKFFYSIRYSRHLSYAVFVTFLAIFGLSCSKDTDPIVVPPDNSGDTGKRFMFCYNISDAAQRLLRSTGMHQEDTMPC